MQKHSVKIKEIFTSIQGEGTYIGQKHIFIRFSRCNLNCKYCDTDFKTNLKEYSVDELYDYLKNIDCQTLSLTGGEPLLEADFLEEFLKKYYSKLNKKIYLETNGVLTSELKKIIDFVDIVAMDIKLKSATGQENNFLENDNFLKIASKKEAFIKVVFNGKIEEDEIFNVVQLAKKYGSTVILQPEMPIKDNNIIKTFDKFYEKYKNIRLIPQVHKFLGVE